MEALHSISVGVCQRLYRSYPNFWRKVKREFGSTFSVEVTIFTAVSRPFSPFLFTTQRRKIYRTRDNLIAITSGLFRELKKRFILWEKQFIAPITCHTVRIFVHAKVIITRVMLVVKTLIRCIF